MRELGTFVVLCAPTARSQAYLQALLVENLTPKHVLVYGCAQAEEASKKTHANQSLIPFFPNFYVSVQQTIEEAGWSVDYIKSRDLNSDILNFHLLDVSPLLTVFSGIAGQIVPPRILLSAGKLLHIHSGWLPDYKGSTTLYYSLLHEKRCAATALLLTEEIDGGPVLARKHYRAPSRWDDIDYSYDCTIRADLLVSVLKEYVKQQELPQPIEIGGGEMYYVIHPLLKHLSILSLED